MAKKTIRLSLSESGIDKAIKEFEKYRKWVKQCTIKFINELADLGLQVSSVNFRNAGTAGTNDVSVHIEDLGEMKKAIVATGNATLFIEFGTGIRYPDVHPEAHELGMIRGGYGKGQGKNPKGWFYTGEAGMYGEVGTGKSKAIHTYGEPAQMPMYNTIRRLETDFESIAKRCFK